MPLVTYSEGCDVAVFGDNLHRGALQIFVDDPAVPSGLHRRYRNLSVEETIDKLAELEAEGFSPPAYSINELERRRTGNE